MLKFRQWLVAEAHPTMTRNFQPGAGTVQHQGPATLHNQQGANAAAQLPAADPNQTIDHVPTPPPAHTPSGAVPGRQDQTVIPGERHGPLPSNEYARLLVRAFSKLDPHINDRGHDGQIPDAYSGTPAYSSPEQARPVFNTQYRREDDLVEDALNWFHKLYPDQEANTRVVVQSWHNLVQKVRQFLSSNGQMRESADHNFQHPVMYQTTMMTIKRVNRGIDGMKTVLMRQAPDPGLREAFVQFIQAWEKWAPVALQTLQGHEPEATSRHNQQFAQQQKPAQQKGGWWNWLWGRQNGG